MIIYLKDLSSVLLNVVWPLCSQNCVWLQAIYIHYWYNPFCILNYFVHIGRSPSLLFLVSWNCSGSMGIEGHSCKCFFFSLFTIISWTVEKLFCVWGGDQPWNYIRIRRWKNRIFRIWNRRIVWNASLSNITPSTSGKR